VENWWYWRQGREASTTRRNSREQQVEGKASRSFCRRGKGLVRQKSSGTFHEEGGTSVTTLLSVATSSSLSPYPRLESILSLALGLESRGGGGRRSIQSIGWLSLDYPLVTKSTWTLSLLVSSSSWKLLSFSLRCFLVLNPGVSVWANNVNWWTSPDVASRFFLSTSFNYAGLQLELHVSSAKFRREQEELVDCCGIAKGRDGMPN